MKPKLFLAPINLSCRLRNAATLIAICAAIEIVSSSTAHSLSDFSSLDSAQHGAPAPAIREIVTNCNLEPGLPQCAPPLVFTYAEFASLAQRIFGLTQPSRQFVFADVPKNSSEYPAVQAAAPFMNWQILCPGCMFNGSFLPESPISHAEAAIALVRILVAANKVKLLSATAAAAVLELFPDAGSIPAPARTYIATAIASGVLRHVRGKRLELGATFNRVEGALVLEHVGVRYGFIHDDDRSREKDDHGRD